MTELHKTVFNNLLIHCNSFDIPGEIGTGDKENSLFLHPENIGADGVVIEVCFAPVDDARSAFIQINTTLLENLDMGKLPEILLLLNRFNTYCLVGHYGVYADSAKLYHKQILIINNSLCDAVSDTLIATTDLVLDILNKDCGRLISGIAEI